MEGLRARKKALTHQAISAAAITLFLERGFDQVSVAEVADAADVSKPTLFKYFASKEDLVLHRIADHRGEAARVVRGSPEPPLEALRRHFLDGLDRRDPVTGLNDHPQVLAYHRMVFGTPSLLARVAQYIQHDEDELAGALGGTLAARLAAAQIIAVQRVLARDTWRRLVDGATADELHPSAVAAANDAFDALHPSVIRASPK